MRAAELVGCHQRNRSFSITQQDPNADVAPDRVDRSFAATVPRSNEVSTEAGQLQGASVLLPGSIQCECSGTLGGTLRRRVVPAQPG